MKKKHITEKDLRESKTSWPKTEKELLKEINRLLNLEHDYGTAVYATSLSALATFNYVACKLGLTGFQASYADLDIFKRNRSIKGPFIILKAEDALYPQYDLFKKLGKFLEDNKPWLKEEATKLLAANLDGHPDVRAHWEKLSSFVIPTEK